jgi:hypothetical protein
MIMNINFVLEIACLDFVIASRLDRIHMRRGDISKKSELVTSHEVMLIMLFGSMQEGQYALRMLPSFLAKPDGQHMWQPMEMERSEINGVMETP